MAKCQKSEDKIRRDAEVAIPEKDITMENIWSSYLVFRIIIGFVDGVTDLLLCAHLISSGQPYWGLGILGCTILAISISLLYVIVGRCRQGDPMDIMKYILMTIKVHAEVVSAFFQGAPSLIIQLIIVWSGVYQHDLQVSQQQQFVFIVQFCVAGAPPASLLGLVLGLGAAHLHHHLLHLGLVHHCEI